MTVWPNKTQDELTRRRFGEATFVNPNLVEIANLTIPFR